MNNQPARPKKTSLRDILFILFTKKRVFLDIWLLVIALTVFVAFFSDPVYEARAKILIKPYVDANLYYNAPAGSLRPSPVSTQDINSEIELMLSRDVLAAAIKEIEDAPKEPRMLFSRLIGQARGFIANVMIQLGFTSKANQLDRSVEEMQARLTVKPGVMSNMIEVSMTGKAPDEISTVVNTLVNKYIDKHIEVHQANAGLEFFAGQADIYRKKLVQAEAALKAFNREWAVSDIQTQLEGNAKVLEVLRQTLAVTKGQAAEFAARLARNQENLQALTQGNRDNMVLTEYYKSLLPLVVEMERISSLYTKKSQEYRDIKSQVDEIGKRIRDQHANILAGAAIDQAALLAQATSIEEEIGRIEKHSAFLAEKGIELAALKREYTQNEKNYLLYMDKTEEARIEHQKDAGRVANVSVANWAQPPSIPIFPKRFFMVALSLLVGFIVGLAGAFAAYYLDHTVKTPEDITRQAELAVLCSLPRIETAGLK